jgi:hypothetical protein
MEEMRDMERDGDQVRVTDDEASGGSTPHIVRYVLAISLLLAVLALSAVWITGALNSPQGSHEAPVTNQPPPTPAAAP